MKRHGCRPPVGTVVISPQWGRHPGVAPTVNFRRTRGNVRAAMSLELTTLSELERPASLEITERHYPATLSDLGRPASLELTERHHPATLSDLGRRAGASLGVASGEAAGVTRHGRVATWPVPRRRRAPASPPAPRRGPAPRAGHDAREPTSRADRLGELVARPRRTPRSPGSRSKQASCKLACR